jgi:tetratricopeptide (TPR) repeat protein
MTNKPLLDDSPWSPSLALHVEQVCNRFEEACKAGDRPRIEQYLSPTPEPDRLVLLRELLAVEVEYRCKSGEGATPEEYQQRFPEYTELIQDILARAPGPDTCAIPVADATPDIFPLQGTISPSDRARPTVPGYEVLGELGRGGMGIVYRARQVRLKRLVALKMILAGRLAEEKDLARFRVEAEAVARLQHPNIVQIYEVGEHDNLPYLALEFVDGVGLDQQLAGTPQEPRAAAALLEPLARAMHCAHQKGIVHRDLKPANILLSRSVDQSNSRKVRKPGPGDGPDSPIDRLNDYLTPKITDFGLAKRLDCDQGATQSGMIVGTPSYMAPEQAAGKVKEVGPAADVYALGAILYEVLTGRPPFKSTTAFDTLKQVLSQEPVAPRRLQPAVPRDLEIICLKCLAKEPPRRYASALALAEDLRRFLDGEPIRARPVPALARAGQWVRRRPALAVLLLLLGLTPFALLAALLWHDRDLAVKLDEARTDAGLSQRKADGEALLRKGQTARAAGDLQSAKLHFEGALEKVRSEPSLVGLKAEAEHQRDEAQRLLDRLAGRAQARARYDEFLKKRDAALFSSHWPSAEGGKSLYTGQAPSAKVQATRTAARQALELFAARGGGLAPAAADPFSAAERANITIDCYELLLILARAVAQPLEDEDPFHQAGEALGLLDQAAQLRSPTRALHLCRAACLSRRNETAAAVRETTRAQGLEPADAVDYFLLGDECAHRKELPQAVAHFKSVLRLQPDNFWAHYYLAVCFLQMRRPDQAETSLTVCQTRRSDVAWVYILRGYASGQLGERARRQKRADQAGLHLADAVADFRQAQALLQRQPNEDAAYTLRVNRAATLILQAKYADAQEDLREAIRLKPKQFNAYLVLAEAYSDQKDHNAALAQLDRAIELQPGLAVLYHKRGQIQLARRDLSAALRDFTETVQRFAGNRLSATEVLVDAHTERGKILYSREQYAEALEAFNAARMLSPDWPRLQRWRAGLLQDLRRYEEALQAYDDYLRQDPKPEVEVFEARALVRTKLHDYAGAVADYSRALDVAPGSARLRVFRGWTYLVNGVPKLARQDFDAAVRLDAQNGNAHVGRGYALVQLGQAQQGIADVEKGLRLGPEDSRLLWNAAQAHAQAAAKIGAAPGPWGRAEVQARSDYQERAVELLGKALLLKPAEDRSSFWREYIQDNAALSPIRNTPGFARLAAEYGRMK